MRRGERGFTLAEVLVATAVLAIGLVSIAGAFQFATSGVATGRGETMAVFLAEQRIEQLKAQALTDFTVAALNAGTTTEFCLTSNIGATASNCQTTVVTGVSYTRVTTITDITAGAGCPATPLSCKQVQINVTYRPVTSTGDLSQQRTVQIYALLAPRT